MGKTFKSFVFGVILTSPIFLTSNLTAQDSLSVAMFQTWNMRTRNDAIKIYNDAVFSLQKGDTLKAEHLLDDAIHADMALVEALSLRAKLYKVKGEDEKALVHFWNAIDQYIDQPAHVYFQFFELGMKLGEYGIVKDHLKNFGKIYGGHQDLTPYEREYPYTIVDLEYYQKSIHFIENYTSWQGYSMITNEIEASEKQKISFSENQVYVRDGEKIFQFRLKNENGIKKMTKKQSIKYLENTETFCLSTDRSIVIFSRFNGASTDLYYSKKKGRKWNEPILLTKEINSLSNESYPFLMSDNETLFFSSDKNGSMDVFVAKINLGNNSVSICKEVEGVNSPKDEISFHFSPQDTTYYFSSNGLPGFGGFDIFYCEDYETKDGLSLPFNPKNSKSPINSNLNEIFFHGQLINGKGILLRQNLKGKNFILSTRSLKPQNVINTNLSW